MDKFGEILNDCIYALFTIAAIMFAIGYAFHASDRFLLHMTGVMVWTGFYTVLSRVDRNANRRT